MKSLENSGFGQSFTTSKYRLAVKEQGFEDRSARFSSLHSKPANLSTCALILFVSSNEPSSRLVKCR